MSQPHVDLEGSSLRLSFPYHASHVAQVKALGRARWDPLSKSWSLPYSEVVLKLLSKIFGNLAFGETLASQRNGLMNQVEAEERKYLPLAKDVKITDFKFATEPFLHQKISFNFARALPQTALFLEQGLGKAKIAIDLATWRFRQKQIDRVLLVCPNSVLGQWVEEIQKHGHSDFNTFCVLTNSIHHRVMQIEGMLEDDDVDWILTNYDALRGLEPYLLKWQRGPKKLFQQMILDESSKIKHATSQRSKIAWRLGLTVQYRNILTGTPITQSAEDIFSQYRFLKCDVFGVYATPFRAQYLIMGGFEDRKVIGYRNIGDFLKKVYALAIRFTKDRCLDLPPKVYEKRVVDMDNDVSAKYRRLERECVFELEDVKIATPLVISKLTKLSQITGGFIYEQKEDGTRVGAIAFKTNPKITALADILEENPDKKVIIWCHFTQEMFLITQFLDKAKIKFAAIHGGIEAAKRQEEVKRFQTDPSCQVFIGQVSTAGFGITLTAASLVIYYSNTYSLEDRLQSEDRCHRIGQKNAVTYIDLVAKLSDGKRTIDHDILDVIRGKASFANEISRELVARMAIRQQESA